MKPRLPRKKKKELKKKSVRGITLPNGGIFIPGVSYYSLFKLNQRHFKNLYKQKTFIPIIISFNNDRDNTPEMYQWQHDIAVKAKSNNGIVNNNTIGPY